MSKTGDWKWAVLSVFVRRLYIARLSFRNDVYMHVEQIFMQSKSLPSIQTFLQQVVD